MRRLQPFNYIIIIAAIFLLAGIVVSAMQLYSSPGQTGLTVDPQQGQGRANELFDLWFTSTNIYDLSVDYNLSGILFSADNNTVSLLDRERRLRLDQTFNTAPVQAKLSSCGNYMVVGTSGGRLFFTSVDQQKWWDFEGVPVNLIALSSNASLIAVGRSQPEQEEHFLELYNQTGDLKWSIVTGPIQNLYMTNEFLGQGSVFYTYLNDGQPVMAAVNMEGEEIWAVEGALLGAISRQGTRLAAVQGNQLTVHDSLGHILWETSLPFEIKSVMFNPQNFNRILVYGNTEGAKENLYYFDMAEDLLWKRRIGDESIFTFTGNGQHIVTSSWRHYKDDFSRMILLDQDGVELISWEVAMRVERLLISGQPLYVIVSGDDGYIDLINLESMLGVTGINGNDAPALPIYNPVSTIRRIAESGIRLFFADEAANLVPVTRSVIHTENPIQTAIDELIRGPAWGSALFRTIPTEAVDVEVIFTPENGRLYLDLSPELAQLSGATQSIAALQSLLLTVSSFPEVAEIYLTVSGKPIEVFGDGISLEQPLSPQRWERPLFIPIRSGERYHLLIREAEELIAGDLSLEMFIDTVLRFSRDLHLVPTDLRVTDLHITPEHVQINMDGSFRNLFPEDGGEKERLRAALVLDALFMTVFENHRPQRVEILLENETWLPPAGYPSLNRFFRQPYYINPE